LKSAASLRRFPEFRNKKVGQLDSCVKTVFDSHDGTLELFWKLEFGIISAVSFDVFCKGEMAQ